jgi:CRISPR-associated protein Cas1
MSSILYVATPGACIHQEHGRLKVMKGGEVLQEARLFDLERVVLLSGTAGLTSTAATALMEAGIECAFVSSTGKFRGFLAPARGRGAALRLAQLSSYADPARRLTLARTFVVRKLKNSLVILARRERNDANFTARRERERLEATCYAAGRAESIESLLGFEGEGAKTYFSAFGRMLGGGFSFTERTRRPPKDVANALLSFGYSLLTSEAVCAVAGVGLDPSVGFLHELDDAGRPSLALDLMEAFRPAVVDRLVLHLANKRRLSPLTDFTPDVGQGPRLTDAARRKFLLAYEERMTTPFRPHRTAETTDLRQSLRREAVRLARALKEGSEFHPFALP